MKTLEPTKTTTEKQTVKPKNKFNIFPITVTEWDNNNISSYTITKSYKNKDGEWENCESFSEADLCIIQKILSKI